MVKLGRSPLWLHARLEHGSGGDLEAKGDVNAAAIGLEGRLCRRGARLCGTLGLDVGRTRGSFEGAHAYVYERSATSVALRGGVELALSDRLSVRLSMDVHSLFGRTGLRNDAVGGGASLGVVLRW